MSGLEGISSSRARPLFDDDGEDDRAEQLRRRLASPVNYAARDSDARELVALEQRAAMRSDIEHGRLRAAPAKPPPFFDPPAPKLSPHAGAPAHESLMAPFDAKSSSDELLDRRRMQLERALDRGGALLPPVRAALEKNLAAVRAEVEQREQGKPFDPWKDASAWARAGRDLDGGIARACGTNADRCLADAQLAIGAATLTVVSAGVATEVATPALLAYGATAGEAALGAELIANTASTTAGYAASGAPASPEQATAEAAIGVVLPGMRLGVASGEARALGGAWQNGKPAGLIVRSGDCLTVPLPPTPAPLVVAAEHVEAVEVEALTLAEVQANPTRALAAITRGANERLARDPRLAVTVLSPKEYKAGTLRIDVARMSWGQAVERLVALRIKELSAYREVFGRLGGPSAPDFIGVGRNFDITTPGGVAAHLRRPGYGSGLIVITYERPRGFERFPP